MAPQIPGDVVNILEHDRQHVSSKLPQVRLLPPLERAGDGLHRLLLHLHRRQEREEGPGRPKQEEAKAGGRAVAVLKPAPSPKKSASFSRLGEQVAD
jgi:hypothetical protein